MWESLLFLDSYSLLKLESVSPKYEIEFFFRNSTCSFSWRLILGINLSSKQWQTVKNKLPVIEEAIQSWSKDKVSIQCRVLLSYKNTRIVKISEFKMPQWRLWKEVGMLLQMWRVCIAYVLVTNTTLYLFIWIACTWSKLTLLN